MSMTREKAIRVLKNFLGPDDEFRCESQEVQEMCEAIEVVLSALTPPTQEQRKHRKKTVAENETTYREELQWIST